LPLGWRQFDGQCKLEFTRHLRIGAFVLRLYRIPEIGACRSPVSRRRRHDKLGVVNPSFPDVVVYLAGALVDDALPGAIRRRCGG
jgi:hypothetical protein